MRPSKTQPIIMPTEKLPWTPTNVRKLQAPMRRETTLMSNVAATRRMPTTFEEPWPRDPSSPLNGDQANVK